MSAAAVDREAAQPARLIPTEAAPPRVGVRGVVKRIVPSSRKSLADVYVQADLVQLDGIDLPSVEFAKADWFRVPLTGLAASAARTLKVGTEVSVSGQFGREGGRSTQASFAREELPGATIFEAEMSVHREVGGEYALVLGVVARDPVLARSPSGRPCVQLQREDASLFRDRETLPLERVCVVARDNQAHEVVSAFRRGDLLSVLGGLSPRKWTTEAGEAGVSCEVERPRIELTRANWNSPTPRGTSERDLLNLQSKPAWDPSPGGVGRRLLETVREVGRRIMELRR
ncbi:MAG TPA: hypothetical protein VGF45_15410 [Polyangia bacterium]